MFASLFIKGIAPALFGVGLVVWVRADQFRQGTAFGAVLAVALGWMSVAMLRSTREDRAAEEGLLRESSWEALAPKEVAGARCLWHVRMSDVVGL
jgi:hypothetical protein